MAWEQFCPMSWRTERRGQSLMHPGHWHLPRILFSNWKGGTCNHIWCKKFHNFLFGRHFSIESDHQPPSYLFSKTKGVSQTASSRIQRWALTLGAYHYNIRHKPGATLSNTDALSRLPRPATTSGDCLPGDFVHLIDHLSATPVNPANIKDWTAKDRLLSKVKEYVDRLVSARVRV